MQLNMEFEIHNLEQIAYCAVLRAFKAQSDALTWEKEGLITELRKELRVSDDEHRELLTEVNADDLIRRIREWRESGGNQNIAHNVPQHVNSQLTSPTVSASRKKQRMSLAGNPFGAASQSLHLPSAAVTTQPLSSTAKRGPTSGFGGRRPSSGVQFVGHVSSGGPMDDHCASIRDPLIGRRVMIRWPSDNNFYEAIITEYNPVDGRHALVYDNNTPNATLEWVNIKEVPPEDIRWVSDDPLQRPVEAIVPNPTTGRTSSINQTANETMPSGNGVVEEDSTEIEIYHTETLIKKVEKVLDASHPDKMELDEAKKMLKEHEQTLIQVIERLAGACNNDKEYYS